MPASRMFPAEENDMISRMSRWMSSEDFSEASRRLTGLHPWDQFHELVGGHKLFV